VCTNAQGPFSSSSILFPHGGAKRSFHDLRGAVVVLRQANFVSALMNAFCKDHLWKDGAPFPAHCMVIDLASGKVYPGIKSIKQRIKDVESACGQIASLWPGISK
jgi:hypothetical protein